MVLRYGVAVEYLGAKRISLYQQKHETFLLSGISLVDGPKKPQSHPFAPREERVNYEDYFMDKVQVSLSNIDILTSCSRHHSLTIGFHVLSCLRF
jgi:hypothetical protein